MSPVFPKLCSLVPSLQELIIVTLWANRPSLHWAVFANIRHILGQPAAGDKEGEQKTQKYSLQGRKY